VWSSDDGGQTWRVTWGGDLGSAGEPGEMVGVTRGSGPGPALVAVGTNRRPDGDGAGTAPVETRGAVWRSPDGDPAAWAPVASGPASGLGGAAALHDVVTLGGELVAVGRDVTDDADAGDGGVWRSADGGSTWQRRDADGLGGPGLQEVHRIVELGDGRWLAAGRQLRGAATGPALWTSGDGGATWTEVDGVPGGTTGPPTVWGLARLDDGTLVAAGFSSGVAAGASRPDATLWWAPADDLTAWRAMEVRPPPGDAAAGSDDDGTGGGARQLRGITLAGGQVVAVGLVDGDDGAPGAAAAWRIVLDRAS
jgi:hypothetical protein